jgi:hypothetical protein
VPRFNSSREGATRRSKEEPEVKRRKYLQKISDEDIKKEEDQSIKD